MSKPLLLAFLQPKIHATEILVGIEKQACYHDIAALYKHIKLSNISIFWRRIIYYRYLVVMLSKSTAGVSLVKVMQSNAKRGLLWPVFTEDTQLIQNHTISDRKRNKRGCLERMPWSGLSVHTLNHCFSSVQHISVEWGHLYDQQCNRGQGETDSHACSWQWDA